MMKKGKVDTFPLSNEIKTVIPAALLDRNLHRSVTQQLVFLPSKKNYATAGGDPSHCHGKKGHRAVTHQDQFPRHSNSRLVVR